MSLPSHKRGREKGGKNRKTVSLSGSFGLARNANFEEQTRTAKDTHCQKKFPSATNAEKRDGRETSE